MHAPVNGYSELQKRKKIKIKIKSSPWLHTTQMNLRHRVELKEARHRRRANEVREKAKPTGDNPHQSSGSGVGRKGKPWRQSHEGIFWKD